MTCVASRLAPRRVAPPAALPVTLAEARAHLRYDDTDQDDLIAALIAAATAHLDGWSGVLGRCLVSQEWEVASSGWPDRRHIHLPFPDVQSAVVSYVDPTGVARTLAPEASALLALTTGAAVYLLPETVLPSLSLAAPAPVSVRFVAGYGAPDAVPPSIRQAILLMVGDWFRHRESAGAGSFATIPLAAGVSALLAAHRWTTL